MSARLALTAILALATAVPLHSGEMVLTARSATRQVTGNLTLDEAIQLALQQNPEILKQLQEIERTRGLVITARSEALPRLAMNSNYTQQSKSLLEANFGGSSSSREFESPNFQPIPLPGGQVLDLSPLNALFETGGSGGSNFRFNQDKSWQVSLDVRQAIYSGGAIRAGIAASKFGHDSAYWQLRDTIDRVVAIVRTQFYTVLTNRALINVAEETVKLQEDQLRDQQNRFEAGTVPRFNVLTAEVALANVVPELIAARNNFLLAKIQLAKTLGLNPGPGGTPTFNPVGQMTVIERPFDIIQSMSLAMARRPILKVQRLQIRIQAENINSAVAGYKPRIEANGGYLFRNSRLTDDIEAHVDGWYFGITGTWDIFDGGFTYGAVKQAKAQFEQSRLNYRDAVLQVELEVQQAYANLRTLRETIRSQQKVVEQAVEALRLANERFSAGAGTQLDVLNARTQLTQARTTELQSRGNYNIAVAEFDRAIAADTTYVEPFRDPLAKLEKRVFGNRRDTDILPAKLEKKKASTIVLKPAKRGTRAGK